METNQTLISWLDHETASDMKEQLCDSLAYTETIKSDSNEPEHVQQCDTIIGSLLDLFHILTTVLKGGER